jgi:F0F1-type ATP synthase assembly protein I
MAYRYKPNSAYLLRFIVGIASLILFVGWQYGIFFSLIVGVIGIVIHFLQVIFVNSTYGKNSYLKRWYFKDLKAQEEFIKKSKKEIHLN